MCSSVHVKVLTFLGVSSISDLLKSYLELNYTEILMGSPILLPPDHDTFRVCTECWHNLPHSIQNLYNIQGVDVSVVMPRWKQARITSEISTLQYPILVVMTCYIKYVLADPATSGMIC